MEKSTLDNNDKNITLEELDAIDENEKNMDGEISDELKPMFTRAKKKAEEKEALDKKFEEEKKHFEKDRDKRKRSEFWKSLFQNLLQVIDPNTYMETVQKFEGLLFVIFVDTILLTLLLSTLYCLYIIVTFDINEWMQYTFKFGGASILCIICVIIQVNLPSDTKPKSGE